eukprot:gene15548-biopygen6682
MRSAASPPPLHCAKNCAPLGGTRHLAHPARAWRCDGLRTSWGKCGGFFSKVRGKCGQKCGECAGDVRGTCGGNLRGAGQVRGTSFNFIVQKCGDDHQMRSAGSAGKVRGADAGINVYSTSLLLETAAGDSWGCGGAGQAPRFQVAGRGRGAPPCNVPHSSWGGSGQRPGPPSLNRCKLLFFWIWVASIFCGPAVPARACFM